MGMGWTLSESCHPFSTRELFCRSRMGEVSRQGLKCMAVVFIALEGCSHEGDNEWVQHAFWCGGRATAVVEMELEGRMEDWRRAKEGSVKARV